MLCSFAGLLLFTSFLFSFSSFQRFRHQNLDKWDHHSKDGKYLATACDDSIVRIWQWKLSDLEHEARVRLIGNLTHEEWQEYIGDDPYQETFDDLGWRELSSRNPFDEES